MGGDWYVTSSLQPVARITVLHPLNNSAPRNGELITDAAMSTPRRNQRMRVADEEIVRRLAQEGFDPAGATWAKLSLELISYGYSVFMGWLITGEVYRRAAASQGGVGVRGLSRLPRDLKLQDDDAHELAVALMEVAVRRFRVTLQRGQWDPARKASLKTFFVGRCLMELPDVHEKWWRERKRWSEVVEWTQADDGRLSADPPDMVVDVVLFGELFGSEDELTKSMLRLSFNGYTIAEIATRLTKKGYPCTEAKVRSRLFRARNAAKKKLARDEKG
jgi:hypothetical protein